MATPKRRSARLASKEPASPRGARDLASYAVSKLTSLLERDETPKNKGNLDAIVSSPSKEDRMPGTFDSDESLLNTPPKLPSVRPSKRDMHPSKAQQSTKKETDSGLLLGFSDINDSEKAAAKVVQTTPSKSTVKIKSPGFEFKWAERDESNLGDEAQRIMDSVREEAARIKEQMQAERNDQHRKDIEAGLISETTGRKIATPRRKGRFSDIHKQEFAKMDSIATHVSVQTPKPQSPSKSLKRTKSRAELEGNTAVLENDTSERAEIPSPRKRARMTFREEKGAVRTPTHDSSAKKSVTRPRIGLPSAITTPTKSSLARAASAKGIRTLVRIPQALSAKTPRSPIAPKTEGNKKYFTALARAPSMKSILHKSQPKYSNDPVKIAAGTHVVPPKDSVGLEKELPNLPEDRAAHTPPVKRVGFALGPEANGGNVSPSPSKVPDKVTYPALSPKRAYAALSSHPPTVGDFTFKPSSSQPLKFGPARATPNKPTVRRVRPSGINTPIGNVESLPAVSHGMPNKKRRRADDDDEEDEDIENRPPGASSKRMKSNASVAYPTLSPGKVASQMDASEKRKGGVPAKKRSVLSLSRLNALARPKRKT